MADCASTPPAAPPHRDQGHLFAPAASGGCTGASALPAAFASGASGSPCVRSAFADAPSPAGGPAVGLAVEDGLLKRKPSRPLSAQGSLEVDSLAGPQPPTCRHEGGHHRDSRPRRGGLQRSKRFCSARDLARYGSQDSEDTLLFSASPAEQPTVPPPAAHRLHHQQKQQQQPQQQDRAGARPQRWQPQPAGAERPASPAPGHFVAGPAAFYGSTLPPAHPAAGRLRCQQPQLHHPEPVGPSGSSLRLQQVAARLLGPGASKQHAAPAGHQQQQHRQHPPHEPQPSSNPGAPGTAAVHGLSLPPSAAFSRLRVRPASAPAPAACSGGAPPCAPASTCGSGRQPQASGADMLACAECLAGDDSSSQPQAPDTAGDATDEAASDLSSVESFAPEEYGLPAQACHVAVGAPPAGPPPAAEPTSAPLPNPGPAAATQQRLDEEVWEREMGECNALLASMPLPMRLPYVPLSPACPGLLAGGLLCLSGATPHQPLAAPL